VLFAVVSKMRAARLIEDRLPSREPQRTIEAVVRRTV
jgi:hypothetical protein